MRQIDGWLFQNLKKDENVLQQTTDRIPTDTRSEDQIHFVITCHIRIPHQNANKH